MLKAMQVFQAMKNYNHNNPESGAWLLSAKGDTVSVEIKTGCSCKYAALGHVYEFRSELESSASQPFCIERIRKLEKDSYLVRFLAIEKEVLRH